ncbi:MAG: hypothetical protein PHV28_18960, partial [Kiritimatiellae bacterium]|nr:hypothetical protein [Kiritimatiellia bacterium]
SGHSNEARWPNNTLLTYTLPRTVKVRESVDVEAEPLRGVRLYFLEPFPHADRTHKLRFPAGAGYGEVG